MCGQYDIFKFCAELVRSFFVQICRFIGCVSGTLYQFIGLIDLKYFLANATTSERPPMVVFYI